MVLHEELCGQRTTFDEDGLWRMMEIWVDGIYYEDWSQRDLKAANLICSDGSLQVLRGVLQGVGGTKGT